MKLKGSDRDGDNLETISKLGNEKDSETTVPQSIHDNNFNGQNDEEIRTIVSTENSDDEVMTEINSPIRSINGRAGLECSNQTWNETKLALNIYKKIKGDLMVPLKFVIPRRKGVWPKELWYKFSLNRITN